MLGLLQMLVPRLLPLQFQLQNRSLLQNLSCYTTPWALEYDL